MTGKKKIVIGRVAGVYGVKGWVKIRSFTSPIDNFLKYSRCELTTGAADTRAVQIDDGRAHGNGLVAHFAGVDDRDVAAGMVGREVTIDVGELPKLEEGDFYWHQLECLKVFIGGNADEARQFIGVVDHLMETGSVDVLVVAPAEGSIDDRERLIPFHMDVVIKKVDFDAGCVLVDWDPEF